MKRIILALFSFITITSSALASQEFGSIIGKIQSCEESSVDGTMIYIPGESNIVITGEDGNFQLANVPIGKRNLKAMKNGYILSGNYPVDVSEDEVSDVKLLQICRGSFGIADAATMNDVKADLKVSGAVSKSAKSCENVADGEIVLVSNGIGNCKAGKVVLKSCTKGYADCDGKITNGCEIDTNNDNNHCGGCFNYCSELESCNLGFC